MIRVHTLGAAEIEADGSRVKPSSVRRFAALLYLAAERGRRVSRGTLHDLICPGQSERNARHSLRELIYQMRQAGMPIVSDAYAIELPAALVRLDYGEVIEAEHLSNDEIRALEGGFLPGYAPAHSEAFAEWFDGFRAKSIFQLSKALLREVERSKASGSWVTVERAARACLVLDPLNEEATLALAEVLAIAGAKVQAVALLDTYLRNIEHHDAELRVSAAVLRRRIRETGPARYAPNTLLPFLGRTSDLEFLNAQLKRSLSTEAQCVIVHGEPGVGKTRLIDEFSRGLGLNGIRVEHISAQTGDEQRPLGAFIELTPRLMGLRGALGCRPESMQALRSLVEVDGVMEPTTPEIAALRISRAVADLVEAITCEQPLALLIDDAHWLDTSSLRLALSLCTRRVAKRLFLVLASRRRLQLSQSVCDRDCVHERSLRGLEADAAAALISSALGAAGMEPTEDDISWIGRLSLGNPLFIATSAAEYARRGDRSAVPESLTELISSRLVGLSETALTVLGTTVLLGKLSSVDRLGRSLDVGGLQLLNAVRELERTNLVTTERFSVMPAHPLVSEAFLRQCPPSWLFMAHRQVATVLTREFSSTSSPSQLWECAEHWTAAGEPHRARDFLIRCADHSNSIGKPDAAASILYRALKLERDAEQAIAIARRTMYSAHQAGDAATVVGAADALRRLSPGSVHDDVELIEVWGRIRYQFYDAAIETRILDCVTCASAGDAHRLNAATLALKYADTRGRHDLAAAVCVAFDPTTVECAPQDLFEHQMLRGLVSGDLPSAAVYCRKMVESLDALDDWARARYLMNASLAFARCGNHSEALTTISDCLKAAKRLGGTKVAIRASLCRALLLYDLGQDGEADADFAYTEKIASELTDFGVDVDLELSVIDVALFKGDVDKASVVLERFRAGEILDEFRLRWIRIFQARIRQLRGERLENADLTQFVAGAMIGPTPGVCDLEIATAAIEWTRRGQSDKAREIVGSYLQRRYWKNPLSRGLQTALSGIDASSRSGITTILQPVLAADGSPL